MHHVSGQVGRSGESVSWAGGEDVRPREEGYQWFYAVGYVIVWWGGVSVGTGWMRGMSDDLNVDGAGAVDGRLVDPGFLVNADPGEVLGGLEADAASSHAVRLVRAMYRESEYLHRAVTPGVRRQLLTLDAARFGDRELAARISSVAVEGEPDALWAVEWATSSMIVLTYRDTLPGHTDTVNSVSLGVVEGRDVAVTTGWDKKVRVWDLATGQPVGGPLTGLTVTGGHLPADQPVDESLAGRIESAWTVATGVVDGRSVVAVADGEEPVRVWDLATGTPVGEPFTGHTEPVRLVATGVVDGRPVAVTGGLDMTVRVWDLATGQPIGGPLIGHTNSVWAVATGVVDGHPVAVTGSSDETVRVWDLATGRQVGPTLVFPAVVGAVAVTPDGRLVVGFGWEVAVLARRRSVPWTPFTAGTVPTRESRERDVQPPHPTTGDGWESSLTQAFGVLLNRPLWDFGSGAEYAAYYSGNWLYETGSDRDALWLESAALTGRETITNENLLLLDEVGYPDLRFDASRSLFEIYPDAVDFPAAFKEDLAAVKLAGSDRYPQVRGADLARLTARHGVDLTSPDLTETWRLTDARIASDGTLLDALRVATGIGEDPDSLVPREETGATTEAAITAVEHAGIRAHLRAFCDPLSDELAFRRCTSREEDGPLVAKWEGAVDQYEITVQRVETDPAGSSDTRASR
ncbi:hypothetical protein ACQEV9_44160 [Streptomyces chartreusis]|uniref:hypothetical protein n=1 Tax=Streptomyces chartreusis TaxID=1969 RepID=UPI003D93BA08